MTLIDLCIIFGLIVLVLAIGLAAYILIEDLFHQ